MEKWIRFYDPAEEYGEFSNFHKHTKPLVIDSKKWPTVEHYFQAQKYSKDVGKNHEYMELIRSQNTGGMAKMLANPIKSARWDWQRKLKEVRSSYENDIHFDSKEWDLVRDSVMLKALVAKFEQDSDCRKLLLSTGDCVLSENTGRDGYWGNGGDMSKVGKLGELLIEVRTSLRVV